MIGKVQGYPIVPTLHVVIPCFNEQQTLEQCVRNLYKANWAPDWRIRVIVVDDSSGDNSVEIIRSLAEEFSALDLIEQPSNLGKGAAIRRGMSEVLLESHHSDCLVIQDADLEYDPEDLPEMIRLLESNTQSDVVYGDRFDAGTRDSPMGFLHKSVNQFLTWLSNRLTGLRVQDMECCYKMFRISCIERILNELTEDRFGIEPQVTAALARHGVKPINHPVSYNPRNFQEGKKIGAKDGFRAVYVMTREALVGNRKR
ncbi:MAG: hypothetical protein CBC35_01220 [Planctomycetes bacterium TMED75]|nr:MAG: hypothetical protein CBC35_01220 [Planctomycetes bacterium TMED75]